MKAEIADLRAALAVESAALADAVRHVGNLKERLATQAPSAPVATDERAAFIAAMRKHFHPHDAGDFRWEADKFASRFTQLAWDMWQARAALSVPADTAAIPEGYALTLIDRSYDQRAKAIIAHNQCQGDLDDKLKAAYEAAIYASPTPPTTGEA